MLELDISFDLTQWERMDEPKLSVSSDLFFTPAVQGAMPLLDIVLNYTSKQD